MAELPLQFISFYSEALLLLVPLNEVAKDIFLVLCKHADMKGFCHPGDDTLGRLGCHRRDAVQGALACLQAANYIHIYETDALYRKERLRDFQISPYILRLRPEFQSAAVEEWESYLQQLSQMSAKSPEGQGEGVTKDSEGQTSITFPSSDRQPDQIQIKIKNQIQKQLENQIQLPPTPDQSRSSAYGADQAQPRFEEEGQKLGTGQLLERESDRTTRREPTSSASAVPSSAPPPREPPNLLHFKRPLPSLENEELAKDLMRAAPDLSLENSRMLVDTYGWECVGQVIQLFYQSKSVSQPASWIRAMLRKTNRERMTGGMKQ